MRHTLERELEAVRMVKGRQNQAAVPAAGR